MRYVTPEETVMKSRICAEACPVVSTDQRKGSLERRLGPGRPGKVSSAARMRGRSEESSRWATLRCLGSAGKVTAREKLNDGSEATAVGVRAGVGVGVEEDMGVGVGVGMAEDKDGGICLSFVTAD